MLYVTGDCHGSYGKFSKKKYGQILTENDIVIICGDFGLLWADDKEFQYWKNFFMERKWQTLFVAGNHENYNMLESYPIEEWNGGNVRKIAGDKVIHLERGEIFNIDGKSIFTFGGASSHDIEGGVLDRNDINFKHKVKYNKIHKRRYRILNESWWKQELPTQEEMDYALENLKQHDNKVDIIISHCCSTKTQEKFNENRVDILTDYFDKLEDTVDFQKWYFGHYHDDKEIDEKHCLVYEGFQKVIL